MNNTINWFLKNETKRNETFVQRCSYLFDWSKDKETWLNAGTMLAMLRAMNASPGWKSKTWEGLTRESEHANTRNCKHSKQLNKKLIYNWIYFVNLEKQSNIKLKFKGCMYMYVCTLGCCPLASSLKHSGYLLQNGQ